MTKIQNFKLTVVFTGKILDRSLLFWKLYHSNLEFVSDFEFRVSYFTCSYYRTAITLRLFRYQVLNPLNQSRLIRIFLHHIQPEKFRFVFQQG